MFLIKKPVSHANTDWSNPAEGTEVWQQYAEQYQANQGIGSITEIPLLKTYSQICRQKMGEYGIPIKWSERNQIEEKKIKINDDKQFEQKEQGNSGQNCYAVLCKNSV